ncbi:flagellin [Achromobacter xylosoxidans]|uniref:flagellin N-terminal helical domain-containing protein n=1 Tax=Alcaligenes xylosoxydans xylosoxydans TaxID=85698 RepID=UPI000665112B|nr:flagellin [Achromobacter xylosoxidans]
MAAVINTNYLSLVAQNNLNKSQSSLGTAIERLSSGLRINSAKDDAAGMAIANRFTANVKGLTQAARNANDGISLAQTTEGAASEINTHLQRVRELSVQAANGSYSQEQLNSMQDEINQRLSDIDRISQQTDFNGVKVLSGNAKPLTLQVGANDGETITLNLTEISVKTLGLDGFNVNGTGVTQNRTATVSDLQAAGGKAGLAGTGPNDWTVTTTHAAVTTEQAFDQLKGGNTVTTGGRTYTYDAANGNFTFLNSTKGADAAASQANVTKLANSLTPTTGTVTGTYTNKGSAATTFEVDATGKVTIGGKVAYLATTGELTTNDPTGAAGQATLNGILTAAGQAAATGASVSIGGKTFNNTGALDELSYTDTIAKDALIANFKADANAKTVNLADGVLSKTITFAATTGIADTFVDDKGAFTSVPNYTTVYTVDPNTGKATVKSGTGTGDYAPKVGATAYVNSSGKLTTETTSKGDKTSDPLKTLDAAFTKLDKLTGELGAVQNRLESTIANLNNVVNNLSSARSRIQDADYATEVSNMSKAQILQQAGTSVLAQANQVPQTVLSLLR